MIVKKVYLDNFLSYGSAYVEFKDGLNVFVGHNAAGKTNLLESIYYASLGKSARGLKDKELINWDNKEKSARIRLFVEKKYDKHVIDILIDKFGKKRITVDGLPIAKIGELMGNLNIVYFSPEEMRLIKNSPADRRRFMDISLCQSDKLYFYTLVKYNKLLEQRNKLLKDYRDSADLRVMSDIITDKMSEEQAYIIRKRRNFLAALAPVANEKHLYLTGGKEELTLEYESAKLDFENVESSLKKLYKETFEKDKSLGYTTVGAHRDDVKIAVGGIDVRRFGSQGQQRTTVLSLKLAEVALFTAQNGDSPVLLMDDVLSELDGERQRALFEGLKGIQTFVTCTSCDEITAKKTVYKIQDRMVTML